MYGLRRHVSAIVVFAGGCLLSIWVSLYAQYVTHHVGMVRFDSETNLASRFIEARLERYVNALIHTRALLDVENKITGEKFRQYVEDLDIVQKYPGTLGIGYAAKTSRGLGGGVFRITEFAPAEPFAPTMEGKELGSGPIRQAAIAEAARSGLPTASARIMVTDPSQDGGERPGFLMLNPIYNDLLATETPAQRERAVRGFVFSVFEASTFFDDLFGQNPIDSALDFDVYDAEVLSPGSVLFRRHARKEAVRATFERVRKLTVAGRTWSVDFRALPDFQSPSARFSPEIFLGVGVVISYLLALLVWSMRKRIDSERRLVEQVRRAIASRDEFISIASHELKTPITSLKLQIAMALRYPEKSSQLLDVGDKQVTRLNRLIDELLDMTRIQAGRMKYDFERTDLSVLVREVASRYEEQLREAGCELRLTAQASVVAEVDRFRIEQVLVNLLSNAMKYARGKPVDIWVEREGPNALIRVTDHGRGIPAEKRELVFTRFERLSGDKTISGLGLGLYITQQIVEAHGGRIWVQSEIGQGSTFTVQVPVTRSA